MPQRRNEQTVQSRTEPAAFIGEYTGTNLIYAAWSDPGASASDAVWLAAKFTYDGSNNLLNIKWANKAKYISTADNLSSLTYE